MGRSTVMLCLGLAVVGLAMVSASPFMELVDISNLMEEKVEYSAGSTQFEGHFVYDKTVDGKRPVVLVLTDANGVDDFQIWTARRLAHLGYAAFIVDVFGSDIPRVGTSEIPDSRKTELKDFLKNNHAEWMERISAAQEAVEKLEGSVVDLSQVAAIGFGFGGVSSLEMARNAFEVAGVIAIHPETLESFGEGGGKFDGRVALFVGDNQGGVSSQNVFEFQDEMKNLSATYEVTRFSRVSDGFGVPSTDTLEMEPGYKRLGRDRAWASVEGFLADVFNPDNSEYLDESWETTGVEEDKLSTQFIGYKDGGDKLRGFAAYDKTKKGKRPVVVIVPDWDGIGEYELWRAKLLAMMGYVGFVADIYGVEVDQGPDLPLDQRRNLTSSFLKDPSVMRQREEAALKAVQTSKKLKKVVDPDNIVAIGYCFGGTGVVELARNEPKGLKGVASFHGGMLETVGSTAKKCNSVAVLVLNGDDDQSVSDEEIDAAVGEWNDAEMDWEFIDYGSTVHGFTAPTNPRTGEGFVRYTPIADFRSWRALTDFMEKLFGDDDLYSAC